MTGERAETLVRKFLPEDLGERIGAGEIAEVFATAEGVLKLYRAPGVSDPVLREARNLEAIAAAGLPAPRLLGIVRVGECWGVEMTRATGAPWAAAFASGEDVTWIAGAMVRLHHAIHQHDGEALPPLRDRLIRHLDDAELLDAAERTRLRADLDRLDGGDRVCHYDFHPYNIIGTRNAPLIVDWADACRGAPAADVARSWLVLHVHLPMVAPLYLVAYLDISGVALEQIAAWLPVTAAARLAEGVPNETARLLEIVRRPPAEHADRMTACPR